MAEKTVAVLCVSKNSIYKNYDKADCYDIDRDVRQFAGVLPVVAHPPCRAWSAYTAHQAKPLEGEKELGPLCVDHFKNNGGVLEHPAHSRLYEYCGLPLPGKSNGDLITVAVWQSWWGYSMRKSTWLCFNRIDLAGLIFPYRLTMPGGDRRRQQLMGHAERAATVPAFAEWLMNAATQTK